VSYFTPAGARPPTRRGALAIRRVLAVLVVLLIFAGIGYTVWTALLAPPATRAGDAAACVSPAPTALPPQRIVVNVYNATQRNGLAARTARQLSSYGFRIDEVANDPLRRAVRDTAEIRGGPGGARQIAVIRSYVDKAKVVRDKRRGATVDLVLGAKFVALKRPPAASCS